ncbi:MAG: phosphate regulon sensor histidine kinase PhoR [Burkholderiaceae bacterium]|nr:phosphate regulon sensor histidine kinase PhoR [Burkholderiaceae bacterium]
MRLVFRNLAAILTAAVIAALLDAYVSERAAVWWLGVALVVYALSETVYLARLHHWAALPRNRSLPAGYGPWRALIARLSRFARQEVDAQIELASELERIHAAVDQLPDGLVVLDRYDHVLWANDAAESLHGIFGTRRPIHHFIRQPELATLLGTNEPGSSIRVELPGRPGRIYELLLHRAQGDQKLLITRDVTERAKLDAMRSDFVANVSHEIRTPVTVIAGFAETLLTLDLDADKRREYLESILEQSRTMQRLVDDLLTISSLESDTQALDDETVDLASLLQRMVDEARTISAGRHEISLVLDGPRRVLASAGELESAVRNLLTNAIRYTPDGGRIAVDWRVQDAEGRISVRDTGIGIAPEHLPRLAERFYRVDRGRSRATGGTGLGLAIVKRIMARHQGHLRFDSAPGRGSTFVLCLPAARLVADSAPSSSPSSPSSPAALGAAPGRAIAEAPAESKDDAAGEMQVGAPVDQPPSPASRSESSGA